MAYMPTMSIAVFAISQYSVLIQSLMPVVGESLFTTYAIATTSKDTVSARRARDIVFMETLALWVRHGAGGEQEYSLPLSPVLLSVHVVVRRLHGAAQNTGPLSSFGT